MRLSFIIISHRPEMLRRCLASLDISQCDGADILVVLNGKDNRETLLSDEFAARGARLTMLNIPRTSRGAARNLAAAQTSADILYFLDDDVIAPPEFCRRVLDKFALYPKACCIGGPNQAAPEATSFQTAVDFALSTPWGAGPMRVRYRATGADRRMPSWAFMLCNLGVRRCVFTEDGLAFPESCVSAEENILLHRAQRLRGPGLFSPELRVGHVRRASLGGFCRQAFQSGAGRMQITRMEPSSLQMMALLPPAGLAYLAVMAFCPWTVTTLAPVILYAAAALTAALHLALKTRRLAAVAWLPLVLALGHLSYGLGMLAGIRLPVDLPRCWPRDLLASRAPHLPDHP